MAVISPGVHQIPDKRRIRHLQSPGSFALLQLAILFFVHVMHAFRKEELKTQIAAHARYRLA